MMTWAELWEEEELQVKRPFVEGVKEADRERLRWVSITTPEGAAILKRWTQQQAKRKP